ncbi:nitroreductase family protein [Streptomyces badius]
MRDSSTSNDYGDTAARPANGDFDTGDFDTVARVIHSRRSVRHYRPDPIPAGLLRRLTGLALRAPSGFNLQARSVVTVAAPAGLRALTAATGGQPHPQEAPVMLGSVAESAAHREDRGDIWETARAHPGRREHALTCFSEAFGR